MITRAMGVAVAGFLLGIFYASLFVPSRTLVVVALGIAVLGILLARFFRLAHALLLSAIFICGGVIGIVRLDAARLLPDPVLAQHIESRIVITGRVVAEPDVREGSVRLVVGVSSTTPTIRVLVIAPAFTVVRYGDSIVAEGVLRLPLSFESGEGRSFNYPMYLAVRGVSYQMSYAKVSVQSHGGNLFVRAVM